MAKFKRKNPVFLDDPNRTKYKFWFDDSSEEDKQRKLQEDLRRKKKT